MKIITLSVIALILGGCFQYSAPKIGLEGKVMPTDTLMLLDSNYFYTNNIPKGSPTIFFYFSPQCPYCRAQMTEITEKIGKLKNIKIYAITSSKYEYFRSFYKEFNLNKYPNIIAGLDYTNSISHYFKIQGVPFTAIYTSEKKLGAAFSGRVSVNQIITTLNN